MSFDTFRCGLSHKQSEVVGVFHKCNKFLIPSVDNSVSGKRGQLKTSKFTTKCSCILFNPLALEMDV